MIYSEELAGFVGSTGEITKKNIQDIYAQFTASRRYSDITKIQKYFLGQDPIIEGDKKKNPDYRIVVPLARKIVKTVVGFMAKPGNITYRWEDEGNKVSQLYSETNESLKTTTLFSDMVKYGFVFEYIKKGDGDSLSFIKMDVLKSAPIYSADLSNTLIGFIRAEMTSSGGVTFFVYDTEKATQYTYNSKKDFVSSEIYTYLVPGKLPFVEYKNNAEKVGIYQAQLSLLDQIDLTVSDQIANELHKLSNSMLLATQKISANSIKNIANVKVWDDLRADINGVQDSVKFLERNINDSFIQNSLKTYERLVYETCQVPDFKDEKFQNASGEARKYALIDFENLASEIETYFRIGLKDRISILADYYDVLNGPGEYVSEIKFTRNLPTAVNDIVEMVVKLRGIISTETLIGLLPEDMVKNVEEEIAKIEDEERRGVLLLEGARVGDISAN